MLVRSELVELRIDLRTTTVDDDRAQARVAQEHDVSRKRCGERLIGHGVTAVLHHHGAAVKTGKIRQRLVQGRRLLLRRLPARRRAHVRMFFMFGCSSCSDVLHVRMFFMWSTQSSRARIRPSGRW